jgi:2-polyprenyl-3-methyl-5-hydroxy-6-metoxy-1,4-benzoquinol methylase
VRVCRCRRANELPNQQRDLFTDMPCRQAGVVIEQEWNERYAGSNQIWSGQPNQALVTEVSQLPPGRALDVGCGEGADAVWLAQRGWNVTGLDVSGVALDRARLHARDAGVLVRWVRAGLVEAGLPDRGFDLVSAQYPALLHTPDLAPERALLSAVAPGGTLLVVHHAMDVKHAQAHGFDPADYVSLTDVASLLDENWALEVDEERPRHVATGAGAHHTRDVVLRARRLR